MPFLSSVRINTWRETGRRMLRNPHLVHGMIGAGTPNAEPGERTLWRWDNTNQPTPRLVILTASKPDWTHIVEQAGWPHADGDHVTVHDYAPLFGHLATGREFAFRLTANPVQNTTTPTKPTAIQEQRRDAGHRRGFRLSHCTAAQQLNWLLARTPKWGFQIPPARIDTPAPGLGEQDAAAPDIRITAREQRRFHKTKNAPPVVLTAVTFEGRLAVTDPDLLRNALLTGIGPAKAYGCGLLTLAPLRGPGHA